MDPLAKRDEILRSDEFRTLASRRNAIATVLTVLTLIVYFGYIALLALAKDFMSRKVFGSVTMGIPIGIAVIVLSSLLTGAYVWWANANYDAMVDRVKEKLKGS